MIASDFKRCACGNLIVLAHGETECAVCHLKRVGLWDDDDVDSGVDSGEKQVEKETAQPAVAVVPRPGLEPGTN